MEYSNDYKTDDPRWSKPFNKAVKGKQKGVTLSCEICKKVFRVKPSRLKRKSKLGISCSKKCANIKKANNYLGTGNPNKKYVYDENMFSNIDTEEKAYLLGWIASDGSIDKGKFSLFLSAKDVEIVKTLRDLICTEIPITKTKNNLYGFSCHSKTMVKDICRLHNISPGKKSVNICFPKSLPESLYPCYVRGYFEGDGCVSKVTNKAKYPKCDITSNSKNMRMAIEKYSIGKCSNSNKQKRLFWSHENALDFLGWIYENSNPKLRLRRKYERYIDWSTWVPSLSGKGSHKRTAKMFCNKTRPDAILPQKSRVSDSGYDLTLIDVYKTYGDVTLFETGIKIEPEYGWYFDMVPRSSLTKTGWMLANSVGVIDRTYRGTIKVPLVKIDKTMEDIPLPWKAVQIIPRPIIHMQIMEVETLDDTKRGSGGFGSTGIK